MSVLDYLMSLITAVTVSLGNKKFAGKIPTVVLQS